jgi:hypothetical protein
MDINCWMHSWDEASKQYQDTLTKKLARQGVKVEPFHRREPSRMGICLFENTTTELRNFIEFMSWAGLDRVIAIAGSGASLDGSGWDLLNAGASDVLVWTDPDRVARQQQSPALVAERVLDVAHRKAAGEELDRKVLQGLRLPLQVLADRRTVRLRLAGDLGRRVVHHSLGGLEPTRADTRRRDRRRRRRPATR